MKLGSYHRMILSALQRWPNDPLRPGPKFGPALTTFFSQKQISDPKYAKELRDIYRQLLSLTDNEYMKKYPLSEKLTKPKSNPNYYKTIIEKVQPRSQQSLFRRFRDKIMGERSPPVV